MGGRRYRPAWPLCLARSSGGVIRRTTASASASYTVPADAAIAWLVRTRRKLEHEGQDGGKPATEEGAGGEGRRERSRTSCLRNAGEAAHMRPRSGCCWCRHA